MRLLILSDLHREVWRKHAPTIDPANTAADVVILAGDIDVDARAVARSEEHTSELQSLMRISYAVFCLKKKKPTTITLITIHSILEHRRKTHTQVSNSISIVLQPQYHMPHQY